MNRASFEAQREAAPAERPFLFPGLGRWVYSVMSRPGVVTIPPPGAP